MTTKKEKQKPSSTKVLYENPYDIETLLESLIIAEKNDKEFLYMDKFIATLRLDPEGDITNINYNILRDLGLLKLVKLENGDKNGKREKGKR